MQKRSALVMNNFYNGLSIIQELGHKKVPVYALDFERSVGTYSRFAKYYQCPNPTTHETEFVDFLYDLCLKLSDSPVIFPTNDAWAMAIARYKEKLSKVASPCVSDIKTIELLLDKKLFSQWCNKQGYPTPAVYEFGQLGSIENIKYPLIVKPMQRRISSDNQKNLVDQKVFNKYRVILIASYDELVHTRSVLGEYAESFLIQEFVPGLSNQMYTIGVYANREGVLKGIFTGRKVRGYPADSGDCVLGQSEQIPEQLIEIVTDFCKASKYFGIAEFEFKKNSETGEYTLIEVNPRSWSWVGITPDCDVSLPWIAYSDITENKEVDLIRSNKKTGEVKFVRLTFDLLNCVFRYKRDGYQDWAMSIAAWVKSLKCKKLVIAEINHGDVLPFLFTLVYEIGSFIKYIGKKKVKQ